MNLRSPALICSLILSVPAFAAVDGAIVNGTSAKPQPNVIITLVQPGQGGMKTLGTAKSGADGKFRFDQEGAPGGPQLLQAIFSGVIYTKMIPPGTPATGVEVNVYDSTAKAGIAQISQDLILFQPSASQVAVNESFFFTNSSKTTFNDAKNGTLHFYLPPQANGSVNVSITPPGGMPLSRPAQKAAQKDVYSVDYPITPGETRFDINYALPAASPMIVSGKILHQEGATRMAVPPGVTLVGNDITPLGQEPQTHAAIYDVKGKEYKVEIQGTGAMGDSSAASDDDSGAPKITEIQPRVYNSMGWILGIALGILALGLFLLYRSDKAAAEAAEGTNSGAPDRKPVRKGAVSR